MLIKSKEELLEEYKLKEVYIIEKIVNNSNSSSNLDEIKGLIDDLAKCRDTLNSLSNVMGNKQSKLEMSDDRKSLKFIPSKC